MVRLPLAPTLARDSVAKSAAVVAACLLLTACQQQDPGSSATDSAGTASPTSTSSSSGPSPSDTPVDTVLDIESVAETTSRSGPVRFRSDVLVEGDTEQPLSRQDGVVDWEASRGAATSSLDNGLFHGKPASGLRKISQLWATPDGLVELGLDAQGEPDGDPHPVAGTTTGFVGWSDTAATEPGTAGVAQVIVALLESQDFAAGTSDVLDGEPVTHYVGATRDDDTGSVEIWVTDEGTIAQLSQGPAAKASPVTLVIRLTDYGTDAEIEPPPAVP